MAAFLGPESPRPFSVISEKYQSLVPIYRDTNSINLFTFGEVYESALTKLLMKYGEINVDDRMCYLGQKRGSLASSFQQRLNLMHDIHEVNAGEIHYEASHDTGRRFPVRVVGFGAEEFFAEQAIECAQTGESKFDKIVLKDALEFFEDRKIFYYNLMQTLSSQGKLIILQRPSNMLTLPYFKEAKQRVEDTEVDYLDVITDLQDIGYDVEWEVELLPVSLTRTQWLSLLYHRYPTQLEILSHEDVMSGMRELVEGSLKYSDEQIEFVDRLLVVVVTLPLDKSAMPECKRYGGSVLSTEPAPHKYELPVTRELRPVVTAMEDRDERNRRRRRAPAGSLQRQGEEWFGTVHKDRWVHVDSERIPSTRINKLIPPLYKVAEK